MYEGALPYGYFTDGKSRWDATGFDTVTPPAASLLLISLDEAKKQLRLATSETYHETSLYSFIKSQTSLAESHSWLQFFRGTFITYMPVFTSIIRIWKNPVIAINSIKYYDQDNTLQTLDPSKYNAVTLNKTLTIEIYDRPAVYSRLDAVIINFDAGFTKPIGNAITPTSCVLATGVFTKTNHGYVNGDYVFITDLGSVTNLNLDTAYYIVNRTANTYQISASINGTAIILSGANTTAPTFQQMGQIPEEAKTVIKLRVSQLFNNSEDQTDTRLSSLDLTSQVILNSIAVKTTL